MLRDLLEGIPETEGRITSLWIIPSAEIKCTETKQPPPVLCLVAATVLDGYKNADSSRKYEPCLLGLILSRVRDKK